MVKGTYIALLIGCLFYSVLGAAISKPFDEVAYVLASNSEEG